jgi:glycosyltransferase involved in cell wall biosynthesis
VEAYLRRSLDALLAQSLDGIELICVNDGSPDGSIDILREYERRYGSSRIVVIDQENAGVWKARKRGVEAAGGEYIGFADPDDFVRPGYAEKLYKAARAADADIACCGYDRIDADTGRVYSREMTAFPCQSFDMRQDPGRMLEVNAAIWNKIFRAKLVKEMGDISCVPRVLDDVFFSQLIYRRARRVTFVKEPLISYMVRRDSIISSAKPEHIPGVYAAMKELRGIYAQGSPALLDYIDAVAFLHMGVSLMHRVAAHGRTVLAAALRENRAFLDAEAPGWRKNPYISLAYVLRHGGANGKLYLVRRIYGLHLMGPFLLAYGRIIERFGFDIKW